MHDADFEVFDLGNLARYFVGYEVAAAGFGGERELFLEEGHGGGLWWGVDLILDWVAGGWRTAGAGWELEMFGWCEGCSEELEWEGYWFEEELEGAVGSC